MKRYNDLYAKIWDMDNLIEAHKNAQKGKKYYKEVQKVNKDPEKYLGLIQDMLKNKTYVTSPYTIFIKKCDKKERTIYKLPYFPDRIVHHAILQILEPLWMKIFIRNTFSSISGRGIHDAVNKIKKDIKNVDYCLKLDIKKFYPSVDHDILKVIIRKKIKDRDVLWLLDSIIDSAPGIPIGNYLSQFLGNLYLSYFDHYVKEILKCQYYYRYCDDMIIFANDKKSLHRIFYKIKIFLKKQLKLTLKMNFQIFPLSKRGLDFLGYVFYKEYTKIRKDIKHEFISLIKIVRFKSNFMRKIQIVNGIMSYFGWFKFADAANLWRKYVDTIIINILILNGLIKRSNI